MAVYEEPTDKARDGYKAWLAERPSHVRAVAERFEPWRLYRLKSTGHRVFPVAFSEHPDGRVTLTVCVHARFNSVMFERNVFGIDQDDLEECDLPLEGEEVGAIFSRVEVNAMSGDELRAAVGQLESLADREPAEA